MGRILNPPKPIRYPPPKAIGGKPKFADIIGRVKITEKSVFKGEGEYCRILDRLRWRENGREQLRFTQYYRKPNGTNTDWIYGQGAGHMSPKTLAKLIKKAKNNPHFKTSLDKIRVDK